MKKGYLILIVFFIIVISVLVFAFNYFNKENKLKEFNDLKEKVSKMDNSIKDELLKINKENDNIDKKNLDDKINKINELAEVTKKQNEDILSQDELKYGKSMKEKYTGEACKNACW